MRMHSMKALMGALVAGLVAACGGGADSAVQLKLTDAPTDLTDVKAVNVTIDEVRVHVVVKDDAEAQEPAETETAADESEEGKSGWKVVCAEKKTYDLLQLTNGKTEDMCPEAMVEEGKITQIRLILSAAELVKTDDTKVALEVPSAAKTGLKIVGLAQATSPDATSEIVLDFDAAESITKAGEGYKLKPTIKVKK